MDINIKFRSEMSSEANVRSTEITYKVDKAKKEKNKEEDPKLFLIESPLGSDKQELIPVSESIEDQMPQTPISPDPIAESTPLARITFSQSHVDSQETPASPIVINPQTSLLQTEIPSQKETQKRTDESTETIFNDNEEEEDEEENTIVQQELPQM